MVSPSAQQRVIVVGGGLAGLAATIRIAESGVPVDLFSLVPVKRSHSVCAQGGINACNKIARQQGYSEYEHFDETLYGGDFLQHQPPVYEMAQWAPKVIDLFDRMGVPFNRTEEGQRALRLFGGSLYKRTHYSGATTGQQLMYALDEQTRRYEAEGLVNKYEFWEFLRPLMDDHGVCCGIVAQDLRTMQIRAFRGDAVVMATGGPGLVFGKSTNSVMCTGAAASRCYQAGAKYANPEFIQVHPTAIPGADKLRLMSESARGEGGRVWVPAKKDAEGRWQPHPESGRDPRKIPTEERWYFLEEKYPAYGNIVPRDIATREIFDTCMKGFGVGGGNMVYLDLSHKSREELETKLGGIIEIYRKFVGEDPVEVPMKIFPGVHYSMGGLWTQYTPNRQYDEIAKKLRELNDPIEQRNLPIQKRNNEILQRNYEIDQEIAALRDKGGNDDRIQQLEESKQTPQKLDPYVSLADLHGKDALPVGMNPDAPNNMMTNIPGLYAFGEVNYQYHGGTRLGANALLSCTFDGLFCGRSVVNFVRERAHSPAASLPASIFEKGVETEENLMKKLVESSGGENPYEIAKELGLEMTASSTVIKTGPRLEQSLNKLDELRDRYSRISLSDSGFWTNQNLSWARAVGDMIALADPIVRGGLAREESRGSHYRTDFLGRDDSRFLKTTVAEFDPSTGRSKISFEEIERGLVGPRVRDYSTTKKSKPAISGPTTASDPKDAPRTSDPNADASGARDMRTPGASEKVSS